MKKATMVALAILASIALFITVLFSCLSAVAFDENRYHSEQQKYNIEAATGMSATDLKMVTHELLQYCRGDRDNLNLQATINGQMREVFDQREKDHMVDVQKLFIKGFKLRTFCIVAFLFLVLVLIYVARRRVYYDLARGWVITASVLGALLVALGIYFAVDFNTAWEQFHLIFFTNDLWQLYETDVLIEMLMPMFYGIVQAIIISSAAVLAVITAVAVVELRIGRKRYAKMEIEDPEPEEANDNTGN